MVDIRKSGRLSDATVYNNSHLGFTIEKNLLNTLNLGKLPNSDKALPYVNVGDDAFGLETLMIKPYPS